MSLFIEEQFILARPSLMRKVGVVEALMLQQLYYLTHGLDKQQPMDKDEHGRIWLKLSIAEWLGLLQNVVSEKTMRTKLQKLETAGYISSRNTGEVTRVKEWALTEW